MKYRSPSCSYMSCLLRDRFEVEVDVLGGVLGVGEHEHAIVEHDHAAVVRRHDLLEVVVAEVLPAEGLGDLRVVEVELLAAVDADHRRQLLDRHALLAAHDVGDHVAHLVVHQRHARPVGRGAIDLERIRCAHVHASLGVSRPMSDSRSSKRWVQRSRESSNRTAFSAGWDQTGCSLRAAATLTGVHSASHLAMTALLDSPCSSSRASMPNSARAPRCSRATSDSPDPTSVGVTKSPCRAAVCITKPERNSSPTSGSNTSAVAKKASAQSRTPVSVSTFSRTPCQAGSSCQAAMCALPSKPSISPESSRL